MSHIEELVKAGKHEEVITLSKTDLSPEDTFLCISSFLTLGKGKEGLDYLLARRDKLFEANPLLTMKVNFELRFLLKQFDEAEEDLGYYQNKPYVSQKVEEALRSLPSAIASQRFGNSAPSPMHVEEAMEILASPSDELLVLSALNVLKKEGDLEEYKGLVEELLVRPCHNDVKTYALMLLSAKGDENEVDFVKNGKSYRLVPAKLGSPFALKEYQSLREKISGLKDASLSEVLGELLDLYALIRYPERFVEAGEEEDFFLALECLGKTYLGQPEEPLSEKQTAFKKELEKALAENPPLLS